ncbi:DUF2484 family protein [Oceaniglobus roseus]|uniref:DUF2484 family protein n=1 Tax=Oceaniglobus roseus TaxID=1737570 RepID=UPI000C7EE2F2|nr:DUF2484 family protein [Kandeliimicrobium roseum]
MSLPLLLGCAWVLAATVVALLPMRRQYLPGVLLLAAAPVLLAWIGARHGWSATALGTAAVLSMFRKPLAYLARRALGMPRTGAEHDSGKDAA